MGFDGPSPEVGTALRKMSIWGARGGQRRRLQWYLLAAAVVVALCIVTLMLVDLGAYRARIEALASEALGMEVSVEGPISLGVLPSLHVAVSGVRVDNSGTRVAIVDEARLQLGLTALLQGRVQVTRVGLAGSQFQLVRDGAGRLNVQAAAAPEGAAGPADPPALMVSDASLRYQDRATGLDITARGCDVSVPTLRPARGDAPEITKRLEIAGELRCDAVQWRDLTLSSLRIGVSGEQGRYELRPITADVFGGRGNGHLEVELTGQAPQYRLEYRITRVGLRELLRTLAPDARAEGRIDFSADLSMRGRTLDALERSVEGSVSITGEDLVLHGIDLDKRLAEYGSTQEFDLVDAGAVLVMGPAGVALTKGYDYAGLFRGGGGTTRIRDLVSEWHVSDGVARARDVATATDENRIAARGSADFASRRIDGLTVAVVNTRGCAVMKQQVAGSFSDPKFAETSVVKSVVGPVVDIFRKGIDKVSGGDCEVFYEGSVPPPS